MTATAYHRILVATDGSDDAARAADHAIAVAKAFGASLTIVSVVDIYLFIDPQVSAYTVDLVDKERAFLRQTVDALAAKAKQAGVANVETKLLEGYPRTALIDAIEQFKADLAVVGSHGRNAIQRILIGSTSEHLIRHAPCPVLVVRPVQE
jgi:nucleotide-binding universal stress UspA family protein